MSVYINFSVVSDEISHEIDNSSVSSMEFLLNFMVSLSSVAH